MRLGNRIRLPHQRDQLDLLVLSDPYRHLNHHYQRDLLVRLDPSVLWVLSLRQVC